MRAWGAVFASKRGCFSEVTIFEGRQVLDTGNEDGLKHYSRKPLLQKPEFLCVVFEIDVFAVTSKITKLTFVIVNTGLLDSWEIQAHAEVMTIHTCI